MSLVCTFVRWWAHQDLNLGPKDYEFESPSVRQDNNGNTFLGLTFSDQHPLETIHLQTTSVGYVRSH